MMNPLDVLLLASTKLQSHKVRTGATVAIAGLLFGLIIAVLVVIQGVFASVDKYSEVGLNNRTIIGVSYFPQSSSFNAYEHMNDEEFIKEVEAAHKADVTSKQAIAKKYTVEYDAAMLNPSPIGVDPITKQKVITGDGLSSPIVQKLENQRRKALTKDFSITEYTSRYSSASMRGTFNVVQPTDGALTYMKYGNENQQVSSNQAQDEMIGRGSGASLSILDASIGKPFITNKDFDPSKGEVPVILPFGDAHKLLDLPKLSKDATDEERRERLSYVRAHVGEATAAFCYRNDASRALLGQANAQQDEFKRAAGNKDYVKPAVVYNAPDQTECNAITVQSDTRTALEKKADANRILFEKEAGLWAGEPMQHKVIVRGVGISGDTGGGASMLSIDMFVSGLLSSNLGYGTWSVPADLFVQLPESSRPDALFSPEPKTDGSSLSWMSNNQYLVEFSDKKEARALLERTGAFNGNFGDVSAWQFGSGTLLVDEMRTWVERGLFWVLLVVGAIAAIILWGIIGRTVADSRRESAVFRAIGATRLDIASIYGMYAFLLSLRVVLFALILGLVIALVVEVLVSDGATLGAQLAYAAVDTDIRFSLFGVMSWYVPIVIGVIVLVGLVASIVPILLGARRNPINDMRDDG